MDETQRGESCHLEARHRHTPFPAKLQNRSNLCYANATMQALQWLSEVAGADCGRLQSGRGIMRTAHAISLPDCLTLRSLFASWSHLHQQHDAGEFLAHCLQFANATAWQGAWQARLDEPHRVVDSGTLQQAIQLALAGPTLQALVDSWHRQYAWYALTAHSRLLFLQIGRYPDGLSKNRQMLRVRPGDSVAVPVFAADGGLDTRHESFQIAAIVYHLGDSPTSGHYITLVGCPNEGRWDYFVCDDNKSPRKARPRDLNDVDHNAYLLGVMRVQ